MNVKRVLGCCILIKIFTLSTVVPSLAGTKSQINKNWRGLAIKGYDPVAFFKEGTPDAGPAHVTSPDYCDFKNSERERGSTTRYLKPGLGSRIFN